MIKKFIRVVAVCDICGREIKSKGWVDFRNALSMQDMEDQCLEEGWVVSEEAKSIGGRKHKCKKCVKKEQRGR